MVYNRKIEELESNAVLWWPEQLQDANAKVSVIPKLLETQDDFLRILSLSKNNPYHVFDLLNAAKFPANLFLKHLCVLANYGGEPIQRLGRSFDSIFKDDNDKRSIRFIWESNEYTYLFRALPLSGLGNKKLFIDGDGLRRSKPLSDIYKDMIVLLMFGSTSTVNGEAGLSVCEIGAFLGKPAILEEYVKQRYIVVSRITGGATANTLGQLAQKRVVDFLTTSLGDEYTVISNGHIHLDGYDKSGGMPFDIVVEHSGKKAGIEISFQVTTNSTIERKSGQAAERFKLMHANGYKIGYVLDGAGNFQRKSAISTILQYSDFAVAYSGKQFRMLSDWLELLL